MRGSSDTRHRVIDALRGAAQGRLPERYAEPQFWVEPYRRLARATLQPGHRIVDVGSGARPVLAPGERPAGVQYVGLDISRHQLELAGADAYDDVVVASVTDPIPGLRNSFDVALSYHVFEHVRPLADAIANIRDLLKPGGRLVAEVPGRYTVVSALNRTVPHSVAKLLLERLLSREPATVFPAHYDGCWHDALVDMFHEWSRVEIRPLYRSAHYFDFAPPLRTLYVGLEEWLRATDKRNLASNYQILATR